MHAITQKIVSQAVVHEAAPVAAPQPNIETMGETIERPEILRGTTYKLKTPIHDHAFYITINDIVLNEGSEHESWHPYEIFINSKSMEHFQWVVGITRVISAVFRKGGDITFLVDELLSVYDPNGGYYRKGGVYVNSLVADIGSKINQHLEAIGIKKPDLSKAQKSFIESKVKEASARQEGEQDSRGIPASATICGKCSQKAVVLLDGCRTCLQCADTKCG